MKRESTAVGWFFIAVTAFLYASKHITAAIMTAQMNNAKETYFMAGYERVGFGITFWIFASFTLGAIILVWPFIKKLTSAKRNEEE